MRFGTLIEGSTLSEIIEYVADARRFGFTSAWLTDGIGFEPLTVLATVGREVPDIELGTAVVRTYPRHPMALAQHALDGERNDWGSARVGNRAVASSPHRRPVGALV